MTDENKNIFFEHATSQMPKEACGVIIVRKGRERLVICRNKSSIADQFILDPDDFRAAAMQGEVVAVVHSHVLQSPMPSEADKVACEATGIEWLICSVPRGTWHSFTPTGYVAPLVGRQWAHGILDCYALARDYYRENLGVELPDFDREQEWWETDADLFCTKNLEIAGFRRVDLADIQKHDALIMQVKAKKPNHCGVYLGNDIFLHQLSRRLSSRDVYAGYYRKHTIKVLRYDKL